MLEVKKLNVETKDGKKIINDFNININNGEIHVIMGPNGTGKSTLSKVIMGHFNYKVTSGNIIFDNQDITDIEVDKRSKLGIFLVNQSPISIDGITNSEFLKTAINERMAKPIGLYEFIKMMDKAVNDLEMNEDMIHRSINKNFSGGERKKNEILQMKILAPKFIILDELDSGLDVDSLKIVCENINNYIKENPETSVLMITHYPKILEYIKPDYVHMMKNGTIVETSDISLAKRIEENGYNEIAMSDNDE